MSSISVKVTPPSATIILNRPEKCNALDRAMVAEFAQALDDLRQEKKVRVIIVTGAGSHFCSGVDLAQWHATTSSDSALQHWFEDTQTLRDLIEQLLQHPKPIIAAVDGAALGFGLGLVLSSDLVVASHRAMFAVPTTKFGLVSGIVAPLIVFRHGASIAARLLLGGDKLDANEAIRLGLAHHIVAPEHIWARANSWAQTLAEVPAEALQLSKKVINEMIGEPLSALLSSGAAATATSLTTEAAAEGLRAFAEKRKPIFPE